MKPIEHAIKSVQRYGGVVDDYQDVHEFLDMTKAAHPDMRHRAILHHSMGPFIAAQVFGRSITNSEGRVCDVRQLVEDHIIEDLGRIPTFSDWLTMIEPTPDNMRQFAHQRPRTFVRNLD